MNVDPFADDLATLGLELIVAEAGWAQSVAARCIGWPASGQPVSAASDDEIDLAEPCPAFERVAAIMQTFAAWISPADAVRGLQLP
jgi:hypothetical protein